MKYLFFFILLSCPLFASANSETDELGRALANYQTCAQVAVSISDKQMFVYYQKMFNDTRLSILSFDAVSAQRLYRVWQHSEAVLQRIAVTEMEKICLSRFDQLSRQMSYQSD